MCRKTAVTFSSWNHDRKDDEGKNNKKRMAQQKTMVASTATTRVVLMSLLLVVVVQINLCTAALRGFPLDVSALRMGASLGLRSALQKQQRQRRNLSSSSSSSSSPSTTKLVTTTTSKETSASDSSALRTGVSLGLQSIVRQQQRQRRYQSSSSSSPSDIKSSSPSPKSLSLWSSTKQQATTPQQSLYSVQQVLSSSSSTTKEGTKTPPKKTRRQQQPATSTSSSRGSITPPPQPQRSLTFVESMFAGAISRSVAQTIMHPANTMKTILQTSDGAASLSVRELTKPKYLKMLTRGAGANFLLSVPHGAINFAVIEGVRKELDVLVCGKMSEKRKETLGPGLDFLSSAISTFCCSIVSTPQMMITDNIMCGNYPNLPGAVRGMSKLGPINGFYSGWWPGLVGKIPSYGMTWAFFQQLKTTRLKLTDYREATNIENSIMGCISSATTVTIMIPLDTIKTRLVTQSALIRAGKLDVAYKGIVDCAVRVTREEGLRAFYKGLPPRLVSVVPMMGIQFGVYEFMKRFMVRRQLKNHIPRDDTIVWNHNNNRDNNKMDKQQQQQHATTQQIYNTAATKLFNA